MADLSKIKIPNGTEYNLKDAQARADIESLNGSLDTIEGVLTSVENATKTTFAQKYIGTTGILYTSTLYQCYAVKLLDSNIYKLEVTAQNHSSHATVFVAFYNTGSTITVDTATAETCVKVGVSHPTTDLDVHTEVYDVPEDATWALVTSAKTLTPTIRAYRLIDVETVGKSKWSLYVGQGAKNINRFATQWQQNGLGSNGENYNRPGSIRTISYLDLHNIINITVVGTIYLCLYAEKTTASFLARYTYTDANIEYDELIKRQPSAAYFRIELQNVEGAISAYSNVTIIGKRYAYGLDEQDRMFDKAFILGKQMITSEQYGNCAFKAMIVSDVHAEVERFGNIIALMNKWGAGQFDAFINCGDTVQTIQSNGIAWHNAMLPFIEVPYINVVGNHDAYASLGVLTDKDKTYQTIIEPLVSQSGMIQPEGAQSNNLCYYYFDIKGKVRIIALDCMYWDDDESQWLEDTLSDANNSGLYVICVSHYGFTEPYAVAMPSLWRKVSGFPANSINIGAAEKVNAFINNGGTFICWLVGHSHSDNVYKLKQEYNNQLVVTFPSLAQRAGTMLKNTNADSYNYICATYMTIDDYTHTIRFMRIGADIDIWGVQHTGLSLDYEHKELMYSVDNGFY